MDEGVSGSFSRGIVSPVAVPGCRRRRSPSHKGVWSILDSLWKGSDVDGLVIFPKDFSLAVDTFLKPNTMLFMNAFLV